ncbi:MAG: hypothetical protein HWN68_12995 [Desulfobacterales bacterium]|nr:hypothetical protein [Desulfobacterales bacterium]
MKPKALKTESSKLKAESSKLKAQRRRWFIALSFEPSAFSSTLVHPGPDLDQQLNSLEQAKRRGGL